MTEYRVSENLMDHLFSVIGWIWSSGYHVDPSIVIEDEIVFWLTRGE